MAGFAATTILTYARALRDVQAYFHAEADAISADMLLQFLAQRQTEVGNSSLNQIVCGLKYFYGQVLGDPDRVIDMPLPRKSTQLGELLTSSELRTFIDATQSLRHQVVIELIIGLGVRAGEIGGLRLGDFDAVNRSVQVRKAKGGKSRVLPYGERLRATLLAYYRHYEPDDYWFLRVTGDKARVLPCGAYSISCGAP